MLRGQLRTRARNALRTRLAFRFAELPMANAAQRGARRPSRARLVLLGTPRLELADGAAVALERLLAALLAMLAINGPMPRARAAELLWPGADDKGARNNLRQRLFRLRQAAQFDVVVPDTTLMLADGVTHDLADLGAQLEQDAGAARGELLGALDFGDCLELADWVDAAREQWAVTRRTALAEIASRLESDGRLASALRYAERLVADAPLLEHAHRRLMRLHYLRGDRAAALGVFDRCRDVLKRELDAEPGQETLELVRSIEASAAPARAIAARPVTVLRPPRLVGREREWEAIAQCWQQRRICVLVGEPGIGKTRLATDWSATTDGATLVGARPGDARVAHALLARVLRTLIETWGLPKPAWVVTELTRLLPQLGVVPKAKARSVKLHQAIAQALADMADAGLEGLVIDDLQFADEASVEALLWLMTQDLGRGLPWLVALRTGEIPSAVSQWRSKVDASAVTQIDLGPLDATAVRALLESLAIPDFDVAAWAEPMARHTGGNPMFILETLLAMLAHGAPRLETGGVRLPAPANIGQLIERRLSQLSTPALRLARVAALAGQDFSVELAAAVLRQHALDIVDAWRELEVAQVIRDRGFAHDLIQEATLRSVPQPIARVLHKDIADYLAANGGQPARTAGHYFEAGEWSKAGAYYRVAADRARSIVFGANAADLYRLAATCFERADQRTDRVDAMRMQATCMQFMKRFIEYAAMAQEIAAIAVTPQERLWAIDVMAKSRFELVHDREAIRLMREGRLLARELGDTAIEVSLAEWEALALSFHGRQQEALEVGQTLLAFIQANPHDENIALRRRQYAYLLEMDNQFESAVRHLEDADRRARTDGELGLVSEIQVIRGACLYNLGQVEAAIDEYQAARRLQLEGAGGSQSWTTYDVMLGRYLQEAGRFREAHHLLANALQAHGSAEGWFPAQCRATLAHCFLSLGQIARAKRLLGTEGPADAMAHFMWLNAKVRLARFEGRSARPLLDELADRARACPRSERLLWQVRIEQVRELNGVDAVELARQVVGQSLAKRTYSVCLPARAMLVDALRRAGEPEESAQTARELADDLAHYAAIGLSPSEYWWIIFQAFDAAGAGPAARAALGRSVDWIRATAQAQVAEEFRESFLDRNPLHRTVLTTATRMRL
jgi:DNA-binding SARP family transcriptional activator